MNAEVANVLVCFRGGSRIGFDFDIVECNIMQPTNVFDAFRFGLGEHVLIIYLCQLGVDQKL